MSVSRNITFGVLLAGLSLARPAHAATLWYNGDFNGANGLLSERTTSYTANTYDDFIVPVGQNWSVTNVFSNNLMDRADVTQAEWEIRTGVGVGNGGTLLASGTSAATETATGRSGFGFSEYQIAANIPSLLLTAGTYWLSVAPVTSGSGSFYVSTTSGANAVGLPTGNDDKSYFDSSQFGSAFAPATSQVGGSQADFSLGVRGTMGAGVPEPSAAALFAGLGATSVFSFRRRVRR